MRSRIHPIVAVGVGALVAWYFGAFVLDGPMASAQLAREGGDWSVARYLGALVGLGRPLLPTPDQLASELARTVLGYAPTDPHGLVYHVLVTGETALAGFALGSALGALLAVAIVHARVLESGLMPWIIASQTVPILAIAPMAIVILGNLGLTGLLPKAIICAYLAFFPVTVGMLKGLRSSDRLIVELLRTYDADPGQLFWKVRLPSSIPFLCASLKVGVAVSTVGAIVAELPTGGTAGLGARMLGGSYYGQTMQIWGALVGAAVLSLALVGAVGAVEGHVRRRRGGAS